MASWPAPASLADFGETMHRPRRSLPEQPSNHLDPSADHASIGRPVLRPAIFRSIVAAVNNARHRIAAAAPRRLDMAAQHFTSMAAAVLLASDVGSGDLLLALMIIAAAAPAPPTARRAVASAGSADAPTGRASWLHRESRCG